MARYKEAQEILSTREGRLRRARSLQEEVETLFQARKQQEATRAGRSQRGNEDLVRRMPNLAGRI